MVTRIALQGIEWKFVEGYYLRHSLDGKQWKVYSEGGDEQTSSVRL